MKTRIIISLMVVAAFMFLSQPAIADDLADLKATHQRFDKAWNTADMDTVFEIWQDGGIWIPTNQGFPVVTNSAMGKSMFAKWLESHIYRRSWYKVDYQVIGNTGLVWGLSSRMVIVKATGIGKGRCNGLSFLFPVQPESSFWTDRFQCVRVSGKLLH